MSLIIFLRGVNVGGHKTFRPSRIAEELKEYGVVNIGAAGTFVVRNPGSKTKFCALLRSKLPFETKIFTCDSKALIELETKNPFTPLVASSETVRFVSIFSQRVDSKKTKITLPKKGPWLVKIVASQGQFIFGLYRRHMKTIRYLGELDRHFEGSATTRNWNTIMAILRILKMERQ